MSTFNGDIVNLTNLGVTDVAGNGPGAGTGLDTGDLRRKYNFWRQSFRACYSTRPIFSFRKQSEQKTNG